MGGTLTYGAIVVREDGVFRPIATFDLHQTGPVKREPLAQGEELKEPLLLMINQTDRSDPEPKASLYLPIFKSSKPIAYLYLEAESSVNYFTPESLQEIQTLSNLLALCVDQYQLRRVATVDKLTKALTRRAYEAEVQELIERTKRTQDTFSLILYDLDFFKKVNDTFGHEYFALMNPSIHSLDPPVHVMIPLV